MRRLHPESLGDLASAVELPAYDRDSLRAGIVHLGLGAFHRAHQAVFTDDAMNHSGGNWGIIGVSLRSSTVSQQLSPQQCLYSVLSEDVSDRSLRVVGAVQRVLVAPEEPAAVVAAIASQTIHVITLTITEKGYNLAADGASLNRTDPLVAADLANPEAPSSAVGMLALGLRERLRAGGAPVTVLSCDNLSQNSAVLRLVLQDYFAATFADVLPWLDKAATFPCSVVDRIVPAMTAATRERQALALGLSDEGAVSTEPFNQWIVENNFAGPIPDWESAGVRLVDSILPFEDIKLRLLNASHSAIAYCGLLAGKETVDQVMADVALRSFVDQLMSQDLMPALDAPEGFDLYAYRDALLVRFANPCLAHRCAQIAMDGSEKVSQRWLPTLQRAPGVYLLKALGAWCYFVLCTEIEIDDPEAAKLCKQRASTGSLAERTTGVLGCARITPASIEAFDDLLDTLERNIQQIAAGGVAALLAS